MIIISFNHLQFATLLVGSLCALHTSAENFSTSYSASQPLYLIRQQRSISSSVMKEHGRQNCPMCFMEGAGKCSRKAFLNIKRYTEALKCIPEPTIVRLKLPGPDYSVAPSVARVNRCTGYCKYGHHSCLPIKMSIAKIPAILTNRQTGVTKCVEYEVEQDEDCACDCEVLKEHCSDRHTHEHCSCHCSNQVEYRRCVEDGASLNMMWDNEKCECVCRPEICLSGFMWDSATCKCDVMRDDLENGLF